VIKLTVGKARGCYSSNIDHRDQIVTINISVFRLYCVVVSKIVKRPAGAIVSLVVFCMFYGLVVTCFSLRESGK
jgi:hypothetical protein